MEGERHSDNLARLTSKLTLKYQIMAATLREEVGLTKPTRFKWLISHVLRQRRW